MNKRSTDLVHVMYALNDYEVPKIAFFGFTCPLKFTALCQVVPPAQSNFASVLAKYFKNVANTELIFSRQRKNSPDVVNRYRGFRCA